MEVYDNFFTAPLDDPPDWEGDDSSASRAANAPVTIQPHLTATPLPRVVPFRPCEPGDVGDHVYALKRMHARYRGGGRLARLMAKPKSVRRTWSKSTGVGSFYRDFRETLRLLGLPTTPVLYGEKAWKKLAPYADSLALSLLVPKIDARIDRQIAWHMAVYNRRGMVIYSQLRPSQLGRPEQITRADCSGSIAAGCHWAGILPKVDWRWTNTDTQILFGTAVPSLSAAKPGDVVLYGFGNDPNHETLYLGGGRVWSFGSYPIKLLPVDYDRGGRGGRIAIRRFT